MILVDTSLELDMFEDARQKLCQVFMLEGHLRRDAERLAFYVVQGVRDVPRFLVVVAEKVPKTVKRFCNFCNPSSEMRPG